MWSDAVISRTGLLVLVLRGATADLLVRAGAGAAAGWPALRALFSMTQHYSMTNLALI